MDKGQDEWRENPNYAGITFPGMNIPRGILYACAKSLHEQGYASFYPCLDKMRNWPGPKNDISEKNKFLSMYERNNKDALQKFRKGQLAPEGAAGTRRRLWGKGSGAEGLREIRQKDG